MKIAQVTYSDVGGAGRAAVRLHRALLSEDVDSCMIVSRKLTDERRVSGLGGLGTFSSKFRTALGQQLMRLQRSEDDGFRSPALFSSRVPERVTQMSPDIVHMHWINGEMLAPSDFLRFRAPLVWTLHDMWAFCGTEHYAETDRWQTGYTKANRPVSQFGLDLDRMRWLAKRRAWSAPIQLICPSNWLAECVRTSALLNTWPVTVIPNAIDTEAWRPVEKTQARAKLGLPPEVPLVLFGAIGGTDDPRKGGDLLKVAIRELVDQVPDLTLVVFGQTDGPDLGAPTRYLGDVKNDQDMVNIYSAADVFLLPSRRDNLPNTALESLSCGTPVAAFRIGGMEDIVQHRETGYLADPFSTADFAVGIHWMLSDAERRAGLSKKAVLEARSKFGAKSVARKHIDLYRELLNPTAR